MKKKLIAIGVLTVFLLTGCGAPDVIQEEGNGIDTGFLSSEDEVDAVKDAMEKDEEEDYEKKSAANIISAQEQKQLRELYSLIQQEKALISDGDEDDDEYDEDGEYGYPVLKDWANFRKDEKSPEEIFSDDCTQYLYVQTKKDLDVFLKDLEKIGYYGLRGHEIDQYERTYISRGILFGFYQEERGSIEIRISVSKNRIYYPEQFQDLLESQLDDGFYVSDIRSGGYLERLTLVSSQNEPGNPYNKRVNLYLKDQKPIQMEVEVLSNQRNASGPVFSEREQKTMKNLLTWMTGDESAAEAFALKLEANGESKGTIGSRKWYRLNKGWHGTQKEVVFRIQ